MILLYQQLSSFHSATHLSPSFHSFFPSSNPSLTSSWSRFSICWPCFESICPSSSITVSGGIIAPWVVNPDLPKSVKSTKTLSTSTFVMILLCQNPFHSVTQLSPTFHTGRLWTSLLSDLWFFKKLLTDSFIWTSGRCGSERSSPNSPIFVSDDMSWSNFV